MGKITIQELASALIERRNLGRKEASHFINEMFYVIHKSLNNDKLVKVKGLGTFKIIDVEDRESVDVNTGDRVLIEGHGKITFTPDALMKELVNKPFSQFETVVLKDGVDFDDWQETEEQAESEVDTELISDVGTESEPVSVSEIETDGVYDEELTESENSINAPLVEFVTDDNHETAYNSEEPSVESEDDSESEVLTIKMGMFDNFKGFCIAHKKSLIVGAVACFACFLIGYLTGSSFAEDTWTPEDAYREAKTVDQILKENEASQQTAAQVSEQSDQNARHEILSDTLTAMHTETEKPQLPIEDAKPVSLTETKQVPKPEVKPEVKPEPKPEAKPESKPVPKVEAKKEPKPAPTAKDVESVEELDKYSQMDSRVRTGAYRITGTSAVHKVKAGDNLKKISRFYLGSDMECYIEVYNGLNANSELKEGQNIKIPKLEVKKGLKLNPKKAKPTPKKVKPTPKKRV